ncbi:MAG: response regulator [Tepidisphaeraceae bacterium]|jgi:CheY-like chemotaxis protein
MLELMANTIGTGGERPTVLVVEDELISQRALVRLLSENGYLAIGVSSAEEAMAKFSKSSPPVVILIDFNLPGMNGLELIEVLRRKGVGSRMVLITASGDEDLPGQALKAGLIHYLRKPLNFVQLLTILAEKDLPN